MKFSRNQFILLRGVGILLVLLFVAALSFVLAYVYKNHNKSKITENIYESYDNNVVSDVPAIYAIMVTGKDDNRIRWARNAIDNFNAQSYPNKRLIIINHHPTESVHLSSSDVVEIRVNKSPELLLGHMRNIALELVPYNALWTTWDDDDIRSPQYLTILQRHLTSKHHAVSFCNRIDFNLHKDFAWGVSIKPHGTVHILCRASDRRIRYLLRDTMEDVNLHKDILKLGYSINVLQDNDPLMYIRLVHGSNTSLYVDPNRQDLKFGFEFRVSIEQKALVKIAANPYL